jgi:KDO2-lipid IV(A) lauroyltransferase
MLSFLGLWLADLLVRVLPARATEALAVRLSRLWFAMRPPARRALERNLARVHPTLSRAHHARTARRAFEHFAIAIVDFLRLGRADRDGIEAAVEVRGAQHLAAARSTGRGVIVLSAHVGNWEWGAAWLAARGTRVHLVARRHRSRWVERAFTRTRLRQGLRRLPGRPLWVRAAAALRRGEWITLMGDRPVAGDRPRRGPAACAWTAALARRTGAVVLPAIMVKLPSGRFAACFDAPLSPQSLAAGGYRAWLEPFLARHPDQWFGFEPLPEGLEGG